MRQKIWMILTMGLATYFLAVWFATENGFAFFIGTIWLFLGAVEWRMFWTTRDIQQQFDKSR